MSKIKERKQPSEDDRQAAARLSSLWGTYKAVNNTTQADAAFQLGITQGAFGQYIRGELSIGLDAALKFANYFNVPISAIKTFDSLDKYFTTELDRVKAVRLPDKNIKAAVDILCGLPPEEAAILRGRIEGWTEGRLEPDKPEQERSNFDRRNGTM